LSVRVESQAQFARRLGKDRSYVTRLKQAGRLVMRDGKVVVDESLQRLEATESPLPRDIAKREAMADYRAQRDDASEAGGAAYPFGADAPEPLEAIGRRIKAAQARKLAAEADRAEMDRSRLEGSLCETAAVITAGMAIGAAVREAFESLADRHAPELAATTDPTQVHARLTEAAELALQDLSRELQGLPARLAAER
jgi:hypothetical protein